MPHFHFSLGVCICARFSLEFAFQAGRYSSVTPYKNGFIVQIIRLTVNLANDYSFRVDVLLHRKRIRHFKLVFSFQHEKPSSYYTFLY